MSAASFVRRDAACLAASFFGGVTDNMNAFNVLGQANFTANATVAPQTSMNGPAGGAYDTANDATNSRLFVANSANNRVLLSNVPGATGKVVLLAPGGYGSARDRERGLISLLAARGAGRIIPPGVAQNKGKFFPFD